MRVLVAGASGAIGMPLVRLLRHAGHQVVAVHRAPDGHVRLAAAGAVPVAADVLDRDGLARALGGQRADAVIAELTALKKIPLRHADMAATNRLRAEGTANLLVAARQLGARRFITASMVFGYGFGDWGGRVLTEADPFAPPGYGRFEQHLAALQLGERGTAYNIADDEPVSMAVMLTAMAAAVGAPRPVTVPGWLLAPLPFGKAIVTGGLRVANAKAKAELGWHLRAPTYRDGLRLLAAYHRPPAGAASEEQARS